MARDKKVNVKLTIVDRASATLKKFSTSLLSIKGLIVGGLGFAALNRGLAATVGRAQSAETGLKRLGVAMKAAGRFSDENAKAFERLSVDIERQTGFLEEDVLQALSVLQTFGQMSRSDMEKTIVAVTDMATVFNEDLQSAAIRLGKAYNGNLRGLQMMGIGIDAATVKARGFQSVLDQLAKEQGGQAVARMAGFEGAVNRVGVAWGEAGKELGKFATGNKTIRGTLDSLSGILQNVAAWIKKKREEEEGATAAVKEHNAAIKAQETALEGLQTSGQSILLQYKQRAKALQQEIDILNQRKWEPGLIDEEALTKELTKANNELLLTKQLILNMDKDINVLGSKAQQDAKALKEQEIAAAIAAEKAAKIKKESTDEEIAALKKFFEARSESIARLDSLEANSIIKKIEADQRLTDIEKESAQRRIISILESNNRINEIEADALKKKFDSIDRLESYEEAARQKRLSDTLSIVNQELNARESLVKASEQRQSEELSKKLKDESLNWAERNENIAIAEEKAQGLFNQLKDATTATEIERISAQLTDMKNIIADAEGVEGVTEILKEAFREVDELVKELGRAKISFDFDVEAMNQKTRTTAQNQAAIYKREFEAYLRANPINTVSQQTTIAPSLVSRGR